MSVIGTIILASKSLRRRQLLERIGIKNYKVIPSEADETLDAGTPPAEAVCELSLRKAKGIAVHAAEDDIVIAADTVVVFDGAIIGKPQDETTAFGMLTMLSGNWHEVFTGVTVAHAGELQTDYRATRVKFRDLTEEEIEAYIATGEPMDKAGGYGIQDKGSLLVEEIEGDFYNVMGLPLCALYGMLEKAGLRLLAVEQ